MSQQPEAEKLAYDLDTEYCQGRITNHTGRKAATELRRLHFIEVELRAQVERLQAARGGEPLYTEATIRKKVADEIWTSAFMHCDVNKDHLLLCIKSGTDLRSALRKEGIDPDDHEAVNSYLYKAHK